VAIATIYGLSAFASKNFAPGCSRNGAAGSGHIPVSPLFLAFILDNRLAVVLIVLALIEHLDLGPANDPYSLAIVDDAAPLSRWLPMMTLKTLQECDNFSTRLARNMRKSAKTERDKKDVETLIGIWLGKYQCVATDDPRLKEK
jgi:hypothetical protein